MESLDVGLVAIRTEDEQGVQGVQDGSARRFEPSGTEGEIYSDDN